MTTKNEDFSGDLSEYTQLRSNAASISGGRLVGTVGVSTGIFHSSGTYGNDQSASFLVQDVSGGFYYTATVRVTFTGTGNFTGYQGTIGVTTGDAYISEVLAGSGTDLTTGSLGRALTTSDRIELEAAGTTLTLKVNGSEVISTTDATYASGKPGCEMFGAGQLDDAIFADSVAADPEGPLVGGKLIGSLLTRGVLVG